MVQISSEESAMNGNHRESVTVRGFLATIHRQWFKALPKEQKLLPVRTRRSIAFNLETESGLIDDSEWLIGNGSLATVNGDASPAMLHR